MNISFTCFRKEQIEFLGLIKEGGQSRVYEANILGGFNKIPVAVKIYQKREPLLSAFERERLILGQADDPSLVKLLGYFACEDQCGLILERLQGINLADLIAYLSRVDVKFHDSWVRYLPVSVLLALERVHSCFDIPLIFGDLAPDNIFLDESGQIKLLDLGGVEFIQPSGNTAAFGKRDYLAPERLDGNFLSCSSDLYSLAAIIFELITSKKYDPMSLSQNFRTLATRLGTSSDVYFFLKACLSPSPFFRPKTAKRALKLLCPMSEMMLEKTKAAFSELVFMAQVNHEKRFSNSFLTKNF